MADFSLVHWFIQPIIQTADDLRCQGLQWELPPGGLERAGLLRSKSIISLAQHLHTCPCISTLAQQPLSTHLMITWLHLPLQAQILSKAAARIHLASIPHKSVSDAPVIFFGTAEIAWISEKDVSSWEHGMEQSFHSKGRKNKKFVVALEQVRAVWQLH